MPSLASYGWTPLFAERFITRFGTAHKPGRVIVQQSSYGVMTEEGSLQCSLAGRLKYLAGSAEDLPAVGDWVAVDAAPGDRTGRIIEVLPRSTQFVRKVPGARTVAQVLAANIDLVFLVSGLDGEFNPARIERYLVIARESGAEPIIVLNKTDLCTNIESALLLAAEAAPGTRLIPMSAKTGDGINELAACLHEGITGALLGSSGVGKSSIINRLFGSERMKVTEVRDTDGKGRHTTKHRELVLLPTGGMLIDSPGMRELQLWGDGTGIHDAFDDIEELSVNCKFRDCRHDTEPGCAVIAAVESGTLDPARLESFHKLQRELMHLESKHDVRTRIEAKRAAKKLSSAVRRWHKKEE